MAGVVIVQIGLALAALGLLSLLRPLGFLGIRSRRQGAAVFALACALIVVGWGLPASEVRLERPQSRLDEFVPVYQFAERHAIRTRATPAEAYRAIRAVSADEIVLFRTLTWLRRLGRPGPESILTAPESLPLIDVATRTSFLLLAEEPDREIVVGTLVSVPAGFRPPSRPTPDDFKRLSQPGYVKAVMNFSIERDDEGGSRVSTETRVFATDPASCRRFAAYWRVIYPGSAWIRRMWLRAIRRRAEAIPPPTPTPTVRNAAPTEFSLL